jgi:hypothetical protein
MTFDLKEVPTEFKPWTVQTEVLATKKKHKYARYEKFHHSWEYM